MSYDVVQYWIVPSLQSTTASNLLQYSSLVHQQLWMLPWFAPLTIHWLLWFQFLQHSLRVMALCLWFYSLVLENRPGHLIAIIFMALYNLGTWWFDQYPWMHHTQCHWNWHKYRQSIFMLVYRGRPTCLSMWNDPGTQWSDWLVYATIWDMNYLLIWWSHWIVHGNDQQLLVLHLVVIYVVHQWVGNQGPWILCLGIPMEWFWVYCVAGNTTYL